MKYQRWIEDNLRPSSVFGAEALCLCPFHDNKTSPALCINMNSGLFVCYSCGEKGHINRISEVVGSPVTKFFTAGAVRDRLDRVGGSQGNVAPLKVLSEGTLRRFHPERPHKYWTQERGLSEKTCLKWQLGYDPNGRRKGTDGEFVTERHAIIPIRDSRGRLLGVIRRRLGTIQKGQPRYLYPWGFKISHHLYGVHHLRGKRIENLVITEGSIDAMLFDQEGFASVALLGSQLHPQQMHLISGLNITGAIILALDNDTPGIHATRVTAAKLVADGYEVLVASSFNGCKDAGDMSRLQRRLSIEGAQNYLRLRLREASA